jgi:hypothetical protein
MMILEIYEVDEAIFALEEIACPTRHRPLQAGLSSSCRRRNDGLPLDQLLSDVPDTLNETCWFALPCHLRLFYMRHPACFHRCPVQKRREIINKTCPIESIAFGHISVMYDKSLLVQGENRSPPHYVYYNDRLGGEFLPNKPLFRMNHTICRRLEDFPGHFTSTGRLGGLHGYATAICNTLLHDDDHFCVNPRMYLHHALM